MAGACRAGHGHGAARRLWRIAPASAPTAAPTPFPTPVAANRVDIQNFAFNAPAVTVPAGTTVTWTQRDIDLHTVTVTDKSFDSGELENGATWSWTFKTAGTYSYVCALHPFMKGEVVVTK